MSKFSEMTTEELNQKLKVANTMRLTVVSIFVVIILAWIVLGYWKTNVPVFVSTIAIAMTSVATTSIYPASIKAELAKREGK